MEETTRVLRGLGLTEYEAKAYIALASLRSATPKDIANISKIPYPSAYDALKTLTRKGWAEVSMGRPRLYRPLSPELMERESIKAVENAFKELKQVYDAARKRAEKLEIIYTLSNRGAVIKKIRDMLLRAQGEVTIVIPNYSELAPHIDQILNLISSRGIRVRIITEVSPVVPRKVEVKLRKPILAVDLLIDDKEALIGLRNYSVCGWVRNPTIAKHFKEFLDLLWENSTSMKTNEQPVEVDKRISN